MHITESQRIVLSLCPYLLSAPSAPVVLWVGLTLCNFHRGQLLGQRGGHGVRVCMKGSNDDGCACDECACNDATTRTNRLHGQQTAHGTVRPKACATRISTSAGLGPLRDARWRSEKQHQRQQHAADDASSHRLCSARVAGLWHSIDEL
jgi:hypothetical protein